MTIYNISMRRTIISLPEETLAALADHCEREGISRAEAVRRALRAYLVRVEPAVDNDAFGLWRERGEDGRAYEDRLRGEWES
jgi:hypothetical protein